MTAKEYLKRGFMIEQRIENRLEMLQRLRAMAMKVTTSFTDTPGCSTNGEDKMANFVCKMQELEKEAEQSLEELADIKREIIKTINSIDDTEQATLLEYRYLLYLSWSDIAKKMHYTIRWVHVKHGKAVKSVDRIIRKDG